jgi:hypothetical protein
LRRSKDCVATVDERRSTQFVSKTGASKARKNDDGRERRDCP